MKQFKYSKAAFLIAGALSYPTIGSAAEAEATAEEDKGKKIIITGSRIKRTEGENALPVTVITKAQLEADGITSAEQLMLTLNIAANSTDNLASNNGITSSDNRGNNGFSGANLRGQGASSTLVLLNGRRVATHGMKGRAVDINSIPFAAIERVEILRDGASAVYGTDAIGGVINFIMKNDYQGIEASLYTDITEAGGGNINRFSLVGGFGDLLDDGFNVVTSLSIKKNDILRGTDRDFTSTFQSDRGLSPDTSGTPYATLNNRSSGGDDPNNSLQRYNLIGTGLINPVNGIFDALVNTLELPGGAGCDSVANQGEYDTELWDAASRQLACAWDYPRASVLAQPVETINFVSKGTFKLNEETELFAEVVASQVVSNKVFEPIQVTPWSLVGEGGQRGQHYVQPTAPNYQAVADAVIAYYGADQLNIGAPLAYRWRCMVCGPRHIKTQTDAMRFLIGANGVFGDWDWGTGLSYATSEGKSKLNGGYYYEDALAPLLGNGSIDVFGGNHTPEGLAGLQAASAAGTVLFSGKSTLTAFDFSTSGGVGFDLSGGEIMVATGIDYRREEFGFNGDERSDEAQRRIDAAPFDNGNVLESASRDVTAIYGEALLPITDDFEMTVAIRHDSYSGFGGTTNPKVSFKYTPNDDLLFRGAYNTGFRVPSFNQLFDDPRSEVLLTEIVDPATCDTLSVDATIAGCEGITPNLIQGGKETLQPEESNQSSFGLVWGPSAEFSFSLDWWEINKEGTIQLPGFTTMMENYDIFQANFIRDGSGTLVAIDNRWVNAGERITQGLEIGVLANGLYGGGKWDYIFNASYLIKDKKRIRINLPYDANEVGKHTTRNIPLRWKFTNQFRVTFDEWQHSLTHIYRDSYQDELPKGLERGIVYPVNWDPTVDSYSTFNYSLAYSGLDNIGITFGIKNLFDTDPPFTAHRNDFSPGAGFDPRVADPRGRAYTVLLTYKF